MNNLLKSEEGYQDIASLLLRISFGLALIFAHGWDKLTSLASGNMSFADPIGLGEEFTLVITVFTEVVASFFIVMGLKTRWASGLIMLFMFLAFFIVNAGEPFGERELAFNYFFAISAIFLLGSGKYSLDEVLFRK